MIEENGKYSRKECEYLRSSLRNEFYTFREDWIDHLYWVNPARAKYMLGREGGRRDNYHIVDPSHIMSHRSFVAGFMEGNTSSTRSWFKFAHPDKDLNKFLPVKQYMQNLNERCLAIATSSNLYHALAEAYADYGIVNTACMYIDEYDKGPHFTVLPAGTYYLMNNNMGVADTLVREFPMTIKNIVETFGKKVNGKWDWSNFSETVKNSYESGNYTTTMIICEVVKQNHLFTNDLPEAGSNRKWVSLVYESLGYDCTTPYGGPVDTRSSGGYDDDKFLRVSHKTRKPFISFRTQSSNNFAYGETGPTTNALGLIKSLNKKAISKDLALDLMLAPPMQGPANLKKSYVNANPRGYTALDPHTASLGGAKPLFQISNGIGALIQDVNDLKQRFSSTK